MHKRKFINNTQKPDLLYISITDIGDDFKTNFHSHSNIELLLVTKGSGSIITTNEKYTINENDLIIINSGVDHCEITTSNCEFMVIGVRNLNAYTEGSLNNSLITISLNKNEYNKILSLYKIIFDDATNNTNDIVIPNCFTSIVKLLERNLNVQFNSISESNLSPLVASIKDIVENYHYSNINLEELAIRFNVSKSTIIHNFKKETGTSIMNYKLQCQLEEAKNLLRITNLAITFIAFEVGFNDTSHFTKIFKQKTGITPKEYRKLNSRKK